MRKTDPVDTLVFEKNPSGYYVYLTPPLLSQTTVSWDGDKLECVQVGEKPGRGWTHWLEGDMLHLVRIKSGGGTDGWGGVGDG